MNYDAEEAKRTGELQLALLNKHKKILGHGGFPSVGAGWLPIVDRLCESLQILTDEKGAPQVECVQVKEKFGGLRFYTKAINTAQQRLVMKAEREAYQTCDVCGKPGELRPGGWVVTRCDEHA